MSAPVQTRTVVYDDGIVRAFTLASVIFGVVGMLVGVIIAAQLSYWQANFGISWLSFGRLRPLHTNAAIFAFVGNALFAGIYYSMQRLLKTRLASNFLSWLHFWGWQAIIVAAAISFPLGLSQGKEYAELIWPIDLAVVVVWGVFAVNFFWTLGKRNEKNLYVAIWFYISTVVTIAVLYLVNNLALPTSWLHSYPLFAGVQDALVQWWYGHNTVGFFLTTPALGLMYYFLPKAAERPVYSYRLSIVHFWALIFVYIWAGPHHLLYTALPDWAQTLGMLFSIMLWAPSWGGMLNGLLTLRGAWDKLRTDPVIKFFVVAITFYGMSTFEGPLLSIKSVNALAHYTDWIIGHVHGGTLGWNGFLIAGMFYWLVPRLWNTKLYSKGLAEAHFWIGTLGMLLYVIAMWVGGVSTGLFWGALGADGFLKYPDFIEGLRSLRFLFGMRLFGGTLYLIGFLIMMVNVFMTVARGKAFNGEVEVTVQEKEPSVSTWKLLRGAPMVYSVLIIVLSVLLGVSGVIASAAVLATGTVVLIAAILGFGLSKREGPGWHRMLEGKPLAFTIIALVAILIGGVVEIVPMVMIRSEVPMVALNDSTMVESPTAQQPYSPLELAGRDIYIREGCYSCHSQMIRPFRHETLRYGDFSRAEEFRYDHPFQWGSKRTGPDLHRVGGKYANLWHYLHMKNPRDTSPGSNMPNYDHLLDRKVSARVMAGRMKALRKLCVPYSMEDIGNTEHYLLSQGEIITEDLASQGVEIDPQSEMVAMIAYLQRLGRGPQLSADVTPVPEVEETQEAN
ncbi:MAG: cytochrome-c oxidase, cbb3-type subunit I [Candidatus Krumholzibacteria bacterium]|jgi:cytochrome c oxidase cbb3-type subunit I/II|nr:cytochrome-c oxidase, cbb3-type subunit I [Candidatus Krumholzibacteria bacterium]MDP7022312.1 cytochrome-c oxidase, cbb3-type subunit I [Candidatus Krumholzibacteria bacterium]